MFRLRPCFRAHPQLVYCTEMCVVSDVVWRRNHKELSLSSSRSFFSNDVYCVLRQFYDMTFPWPLLEFSPTANYGYVCLCLIPNTFWLVRCRCLDARRVGYHSAASSPKCYCRGGLRLHAPPNLRMIHRASRSCTPRQYIFLNGMLRCN